MSEDAIDRDIEAAFEYDLPGAREMAEDLRAQGYAVVIGVCAVGDDVRLIREEFSRETGGDFVQEGDRIAPAVIELVIESGPKAGSKHPSIMQVALWRQGGESASSDDIVKAT